jgi:hypothetical protein
MKKLFTLLILAAAPCLINAQCSTTDATGCECPDGSQECDLLPDITISWECLENGADGPNETPGRLEVSGSTPNIGHGPLNMRGADQFGYRWFVCGTDTVSIYDPWSNEEFECPNGAMAEHIQFQRIYHKSGDEMSFWEHMTPNAMTYHPTHGHNHFDEWGIFTLRYEDPSEPSPLDWPIVGRGHKLGFCLMDYYTCSESPNDDCRDDNTVYQQGNVLDNSDFPNYGLGGGNYGCGQVSQGISSGYTDVYYEYLDGMWVDIPEETCNGDYWLVYEVDPNDVVIEENEDNNFTAIPITLTEQGSTGTPQAVIHAQDGTFICEDDSVLLSATAGSSYLWSTGETTSTIYGHPDETYTVNVTGYCGEALSQAVSISSVAKPSAPETTGDLVCIPELGSTGSGTLTATGSNVIWFDEMGNEMGTGNTFETPQIGYTTNYYAADVISDDSNVYSGKTDNTGDGGYLNNQQGLVFDTYMPITIESVKVYAEGPGYRTIVVTDQVDMYVTSGVFLLEDGEQRVDLNFEIPTGVNFQIGLIGDINLYRNEGGVNYPYTIADTLSIHDSTYGSSHYYYFYDWEISAGQNSCRSDMVMSTAVVEICSGIADQFDMSDHITAYPNPSNGEFTLDIRMPGIAEVSFQIMDLTGKRVYDRYLGNVSGTLTETVSIPDVSSGVYGLAIEIDNRRYFKRLVIH